MITNPTLTTPRPSCSNSGTTHPKEPTLPKPITTTDLAAHLAVAVHKNPATVGFGVLGPREGGDAIVVMTGDQRFRVTVEEIANDEVLVTR